MIKSVIRENAESIKLRIVYDTSARENSKSLSLNGYLETGPALQNLLRSILIRAKFKPIALCGDLQKVFLQIRIKKEDCNALRFHWVRKEDPNQIEILRYTRLVFGLVHRRNNRRTSSSYTEKYTAEVAEIRDDIYFDDLSTGGDNFEQMTFL